MIVLSQLGFETLNFVQVTSERGLGLVQLVLKGNEGCRLLAMRSGESCFGLC